MKRFLHELALDAVNGFKAARRQRKLIDSMRAEEERLDKLKAQVVSVGRTRVFTRDGKVVGVYLFDGWAFVSDARIPEQRIGMDGVDRYLGWTPTELAEIYARRSEFTV